MKAHHLKAYYLLLGLFTILGIFFMRGGVTGFAVAENCLSGECQELGPTVGAPAAISLEDSNALSTIGIMIIIISVAMVAGYANQKKKRLSAEGFD
ncbi:hypothetical protein JXB28_00535 [Candidatus Woesearchaeota archaeon]|nr:hypothetical protein [Candidatus Woesearchaeota archaeon]